MIITLFKTSKSGSMQYYTLHNRQALLTEPYALTVAWRTGQGKEHDKIYGFETMAEMDKKIRSIFSKKIKAGYKLLYSFMREKPADASPDSDIAAFLEKRKHG